MNFHSSHNTCYAEICPKGSLRWACFWQQFWMSPRGCCFQPKGAGTCPILACSPHGGYQRGLAALSTDTGRVYWAAHPAEGQKKVFKYFLSLAFEIYWPLQYNRVPLVTYSTSQSPSKVSPLTFCLQYHKLHQKKGRQLVTLRTTDKGTGNLNWTETVTCFFSKRFFYIKSLLQNSAKQNDGQSFRILPG